MKEKQENDRRNEINMTKYNPTAPFINLIYNTYFEKRSSFNYM
jgi:hypothetical protein